MTLTIIIMIIITITIMIIMIVITIIITIMIMISILKAGYDLSRVTERVSIKMVRPHHFSLDFYNYIGSLKW